MIKLDKCEYPARMFMNSNNCIEIKGGANKWGSGLKLRLREVAKKTILVSLRKKEIIEEFN